MAGFCQKELYCLFHKFYKSSSKQEDVVSYIKNNCTVKENEVSEAVPQYRPSLERLPQFCRFFASPESGGMEGGVGSTLSS